MSEVAVAHEGHPHLVMSDDRFTRFMTRLWTRAPRWSAPLAILTCFGGGMAYTLAVHPADADAFTSPTCLIKLTTGLDCPGCGGTRAFWYLLHGNIPAAARSHALAVFAVPYLVYMYVAWSFNVRSKVIRRKCLVRMVPAGVGAVTLPVQLWRQFFDRATDYGGRFVAARKRNQFRRLSRHSICGAVDC